MHVLGSIQSISMRLGLVFLATAACNPLRADSLQGALPANHSLIAPNLESFRLVDNSGDARSQIVAVTDGADFAQALHVETSRRAANDYNIQLKLPLPTVAFKTGDVIWVSAWAPVASPRRSRSQ